MTHLGTAEDVDFTTLVRPGDTVMWTQGAGEPVSLVERLLEQRHDIGPFRVVLGATYSSSVRPEHADVVSFVGFGAVGANRALHAAGALDLVPCHLSDVPGLVAGGRLGVDVVLVQVSERDRRGSPSLGVVNGYVRAAVKAARVVVAEVNENAPWTYARSPLEHGDIDIEVRSCRPLVEVSSGAIGEVDRAIARNVAELVPDGAVLQLGIGSVPAAVAAALGDHRDLGLHSGIVGDSLVSLVQSGVLTNSRKTIDTGITVTGGLAGTRTLYEFAHLNSQLRVDPVTYTHSHQVLASLDRLVAVNSAVEVDLTGQAGSELAGRSYVGTVGGQVDFVRGALASRGGRSVLALPSRTRTGRSRIVPTVSSGVVTVPRSDADVVVTEHGAAELRGRTLRERVRRMIAVAHPDDRASLDAQAGRVVGWR